MDSDSISRRKRLLVGAGYALGLIFLVFYFIQFMRLPPNHNDGGLVLHYIDEVSHGRLPFRDFVDSYGPLNWPLPVLFYTLAGRIEFGVRIWMVLLKVLVVALGFVLVRRLIGTFWALMASVWTTVLFGQAWLSLQIAYAFLNVIPWLLGAWCFLVLKPLRGNTQNLVVAALLTTGTLWVKINSGMFLLAAGMFHCLYWHLPPADDVRPSWENRRAVGVAFRAARVLGLVAIVGTFYVFVHRFFNIWYFAYLIGPLMLVAGWTGWCVVRKSAEPPHIAHHIRSLGLYGGLTLFSSVALLLVYAGGFRGARQYIAEIAGFVASIDYMLPFEKLGKPGWYVGFGENYWLQVPWLLTALFAVWLFARRGQRGTAAYGSADWPRAEAAATSLFAMATLNAFTLYSRSDDTHVFAAMLPMPPVLFILAGQLERLLAPNAKRPGLVARAVVSAAVLSYASTIAVVPTFDVFRQRGEWMAPRLKYLRYRTLNDPYVRNVWTWMSDNEWDRTFDEMGQFIASVTTPGEPILIMTHDRLLQYITGTVPVGGRYHYYLYCVSVSIMSRKKFDTLVPASVLEDILRNPPRVIVDHVPGLPWILDREFPELLRLRDSRYDLVQQYRYLGVYMRRDAE